MKHFFRLLAVGAVAALALAACSGPFSTFTGTLISSSDISAAQKETNAGPGNSISLTGLTPATLANATKQTVTFTFNKSIDSSSLSAIEFLNLQNPSSGTDAYAETTAITPTSGPTIVPTSSGTTVKYVLDLTNASSIIEVYIDATKLTANGGTSMLDTNGNNVQGEAGDSIYRYINVTGGSPAVTSGQRRRPQETINIAYTGGIGTGSTSVTFNVALSASGNTPNVSATDLDGVVKLQSFDGSKWNDVPLASASSFTGGTYTINVAAMKDKQIYRAVEVDPYKLVESTASQGFKHQASYDSTKTLVVLRNPTPTNGALYEKPLGASIAYSKDSNGLNDIVTLSGITTSALGLDASTATTANVKLFDVTKNSFIGIDAITVETGAKPNDTLVIQLPPGHVGSTPGDTVQVWLYPGLIDQGATTSTSDDLMIGDTANSTVPPYFVYKSPNTTGY